MPISVDTFYASVAVEAVRAGANCVNDVSGGTLEPRGRLHMFTTVAGLGVPYILMHMRGDPTTMVGLAQYGTVTPSPDGGGSSGSGTSPPTTTTAREEASAVLAEVSTWLDRGAAEAVRAGVLRWNIVLDPGIGFAKKAVHSFALLAPRASLRALRYPTLYGPSRKSFLGAATGKADPGERVWATAAAVTACVCVGADIVRVHDVGPMVDVVRTADAAFRGPFTG